MRSLAILTLLASLLAGCAGTPPADAVAEADVPAVAAGPFLQETAVDLLPLAQAGGVYPVLTGAAVDLDRPEGFTSALFEARLETPVPPLPAGRLRLGSESGPIGVDADSDGDGVYRIELTAPDWRGDLGVTLTPEGPAGAHAGGRLAVRVTAFFGGPVPQDFTAF